MTKVPFEVVFHGMDRSEAVERWVSERMERLARHHERLHRCRVVVDAPHRHHHKGALFEVRVEVSTPHDQVHAVRGRNDQHAYEDVYVALRDAFEAVERSLDKHAEVRRGDVKTHGA